MPSPASLLDRVGTAMKSLGALCLVSMAAVTGLDVAGRGLFNHPLFGSEEIVTILAVLAVACALPAAHTDRSHIGVELLMRRFPRRVRMIVRLCTDCTALCLFSLVTWRMWLYGDTQQASGRVSMNLELPEYFVIYALSLGFLVFTLMIARDILTLAYKKEE